MIVPPKEFFQFCARHVSLLRDLEQRATGTDLSESEIIELAKKHAVESEEQPAFLVKSLRDLRILISTDQSGQYFLMAEPVRGILRYLLEEAKPASAETVQSYVNQLQKLSQKLGTALDAEEPGIADLALSDITQTLRRFHDDVSATQISVLSEVARFKTDKRPVSAREKYQRIVWWMQQYIAPMIDVIRVNGAMQATFSEVEQILERASLNPVVISSGAVERNLRLLRLSRRHALNVFEQSGKEIAPLYQSLARSSNLAAGAAYALNRLRLIRFEEWTQQSVVGVFSLRQQGAYSDKAIIGAIQRLLNNPPLPPPAINFGHDGKMPAALEHRRWLNSLPGEIAKDLPVDDLLKWLSTRYLQFDTAQLLAGFSNLFFDVRFRARFMPTMAQNYETAHHVICAQPVRIEALK
ncbi:MAG: hypothetical protein ACREE6_02150 [Limisphaerales bacterium]